MTGISHALFSQRKRLGSVELPQRSLGTLPRIYRVTIRDMYIILIDWGCRSFVSSASTYQTRWVSWNRIEP